MKRKLCFALALVMALCVCIFANAETNAEQYENAMGLLKENKYAEARTAFAALGSYADSPRYVMYCSAIVAGYAGSYEIAASNLSNLGDFLDSSLLATYYAGLSWESAENYEKALEVLDGITLYKDVAERILTYPVKILERDYKKADAEEQDGKLESALSGFKELGNYKDSKVRVIAVQEKINERDYEKADKAEQQNKLEDALAGFAALGSYKDSADRVILVQEKIKESAYATADKAEQDGDYATAYSGFVALGDYKDSKDRAIAVQDKGNYAKALQYAMDGKYARAYELFTALGDYMDSKEKAYVTGVSTFASKITDLGDGTAAFQFHNVWGVIDVTTNTTASPNWDEIGSFNEFDLAKVTKNKHYGYINRQGKVIIPCSFSQVSDFDSNGICTVTVSDNKKLETYSTRERNYHFFGLYDYTGKKITDTKWLTVGNSYNGNPGSASNTARVKTPNYSDGKIRVMDSTAKWGFIDMEGQLVGEVRWTAIGNFSEGMAAVSEDGLFGYIDPNSKIVIQPQYQDARIFSEGQAWVKTSNGLWQCIDGSNKIIIPARYSQVTEFSNGHADVELPNVGWQIIDLQGNLVYFVGESGSDESDENENDLIGKPRMGIYATTSTGEDGAYPKGAYIIEVEAGTPADKGGLKAGDIIVEVNGQVISSYNELTEIIFQLKEGDEMALKVFRPDRVTDAASGMISTDGEYIDVKVVLAIVD